MRGRCRGQGVLKFRRRAPVRARIIARFAPPRRAGSWTIGGSMKALAIRRYKAPMELMELPQPEAGPGDLLVRVRAASVNPLDYKIRDGGVKLLLRYSFPLLL